MEAEWSACIEGVLLGDSHYDGLLDILDLVSLANLILDNDFSPSGDMNQDSQLNILDILNITLLYPEQFLLADREFILDVSDLEDELGFKPKFHDKDMLLRAYKSYEEGF